MRTTSKLRFVKNRDKPHIYFNGCFWTYETCNIRRYHSVRNNALAFEFTRKLNSPLPA